MVRGLLIGGVTGLILGFFSALPWAKVTIQEQYQQKLEESGERTMLFRDKLDESQQKTENLSRKLEVANDLIAQQGLAFMNCLLLHDSSQDSLLLLNPSFCPPPPPALSP